MIKLCDCYWLLAAPVTIFGIACLASQLTSPKVMGGSYSGYVGGMWRGDEGMNIRVTPPVQYAEDVLGLIIPYLLIGIGLRLTVASYKRRKSDRDATVLSRAETDSPYSENSLRATWPPEIKRD